MRRDVIEVTCDVCGCTEQFQEKNPWHRTVWNHGADYYGTGYKLSASTMDICDKCLGLATRLYYDGVKYVIRTA